VVFRRPDDETHGWLATRPTRRFAHPALDARGAWSLKWIEEAEVAELADALGSGPSGLTMPVEVQVLSSALCRVRGCVKPAQPLILAPRTPLVTNR